MALLTTGNSLCFIGVSNHAKKIRKLIEFAAKSDVSVILRGPTGTGKDLVAKLIHDGSARKDESFFPINSSAIAKDLIESELFGYMPGSFTGASRDGKAGYFKYADGGTLFLDEITETSLDFQVKILRALEDGYYYRLGAATRELFNIRFICGTNRSVGDYIKEGKFRDDLYYRLYGIEIEIPPLSERKEDIRPLIDYYVKEKLVPENSESHNVKIVDGAWTKIEAHEWNGNVRELFAVIRLAYALAIHDEEYKVTEEHIRFPNI